MRVPYWQMSQRVFQGLTAGSYFFGAFLGSLVHLLQRSFPPPFALSPQVQPFGQ